MPRKRKAVRIKDAVIEKPVIKFKDEPTKTLKVIKGQRRVRLVKPEELGEDKKISILFDPMFKTMFANSERIENSAKLISYHLDVGYDYLLDNLRIANSELNKERVMSKGERADFVAVIDNVNVNIEVNNNPDIETLYRNIDFLHRLFSKDIRVGSSYSCFGKVIQLNISNFTFEGINDVTTTFYLRDEKGNVLTTDICIINISIPNLYDKLYNEGIEALTEEERYILVLVEPDTYKAREIGEGFDFMQRTIDKQIEYGHEPELYEAYDKEWAARSDSFKEGHDSGLEEGKEIGLEEGKVIGIGEGQSKLIQSLVSSGMSIEEISSRTNLSIEEINSLLNL